MSRFRVALTFDAEHPDRPWCPPGNAERILDVLASDGVRATFFVQGRWAEAYPETARRIADEGHLVGHHSHYHARMPLLLDGGLRSDIADGRGGDHRGDRGVDPHLGSDARSARVTTIRACSRRCERPAIATCIGTSSSRTGSRGGRAPRSRRTAIAGATAHGDGAVVLLHTWPGGTGDAIATMIEGLAEAGATFVRIDELEELP